jgi:hypothetical protein
MNNSNAVSVCINKHIAELPRINILAMAKSLTQPELKQYNTNGLLDTNS